MARSKSAAVTVPIPKDDADVRETLRRIGEIERSVAVRKASTDDAIAKLRKAFGDDVEAELLEAKDLRAGLQIYCATHRDRLTGGGQRKSYDFTTGTVAWRNRPPKVTIRGVDAVIAALFERGLTKFIRTKAEVNKEAMLDQPELAQTIAGVSIGSAGEEFIVEIAEDTAVEGA